MCVNDKKPLAKKRKTPWRTKKTNFFVLTKEKSITFADTTENIINLNITYGN